MQRSRHCLFPGINTERFFNGKVRDGVSRDKGHIPIRTCISCGRKGSKKSMIRLVLNEGGSVVIDRSGSAPGRGAYVCNEARCIELLKNGKRLSRPFTRKC